MEFRGQDQANNSNYFPPSAAAAKDSSPRLPTASTPMVSSLAERKDHLNHHNDHHLIHQIDSADLTPDLAPPAPTGSGLISRSPPPPASATATTTTAAAAAAAAANKSKVTYRECLKNHAANMGGHVVDGCGEFMPSGQDGTQDSLKCAACECHRNFHRKESDGERQQQQQQPKYLLPSNSFSTTHHLYKNNNTLPHPPLPLPPLPPPHHHHHHNNQHHRHGYRGSMMNFGGGGGGGGAGEESSSEDLNGYESNNNFIQGKASVLLQPSSMRKRFRTKFSPEQKEKMMELADKLDWKTQKQDDQEVLQFCSQLGIKRKVFKVWMHNNKQASKKKPM